MAEAPPSAESGRFFYFEDVYLGDSLFLETMKVLFPNDTQISKNIRSIKRKFLQRFKEAGFYLIDSINVPMAKSSTRRQKCELIRQAMLGLMQRLRELASSDVKIIFISKTVYEVCADKLKREGFNIINEEMIDFPGSGGQRDFREKLGRLLIKHGWVARDATAPWQ